MIDLISFDGLDCQAVNSFNDSSDQCLFVRTRDDCFDEEGWVDYPMLFYCSLGATSKLLPLLVSAGLLVIYFLALGTTAEEFMCPSLESLAKSLRLSENIAGVTFLALGNGAPDIFASIAGIRQSRPELVIGQLFGGGIFVTTVVVGAIILTGNFKVMERPICRDIYFYASSCFIVWSIAYIGTIFLWESITVLVVYVVYIGVVIVGRIIYTRQTQTPQNAVPSVIITGCSEMQSCTQASSQTSRRESLHSVSKILKVARKRQFSISSFNSTNPLSISDDDHRQTLKSGRLYEFFSPIMPFKWEELKHESVLAIVLAIVKAPIQTALILTIPTIDPEDPEESWSRKLNCLHLVTGPLMIMVAAGGAGVSYGGIPCPAIVALTGLVLGLVVFFTSKPDSPPIYYPAFSLLAFFVSCCWTYSFASEVVALLETLGFLMNVSEAILGLTVLAWGNSLGDLIANVAMARHGYQRMAISACFGGPLLNLLLGIGIPYSIVLPETENFSIKIQYTSMFTLLLIVIMIELTATISIFMWTGFRSVKYHGFVLIALYLTYLVFALLIELHIL